MDVDAASDVALNFLQFIGTIAFAISGALVAGRRKMDWFGVVVLAVMVAVGGGSLRDLLLGVTPVFWVQTPWFVLLAGITALLTIPLNRLGGSNHQNFLLLSDAVGLAVFAVLGTEKALEVGANAFVAIIMGVVTGVFGGVLRDLLASRRPAILYGDFYALAAMIGCSIFVLLLLIPVNPLNALWISIGAILVLRLIAIIRNWSLPEFALEDKD
jgi:uncharacterized membrane protein YeiH